MIAAVFFGWQVAEGSYGLPALACTLTVAAVLVRLTRLPVDAILFGFLIIGYVVGNRGFAQLMPVAGLPLLRFLKHQLAGRGMALRSSAQGG